MQERIYRTPILDVADLNRRLIVAWSGLQHVIDEATIGLTSGVVSCAPL